MKWMVQLVACLLPFTLFAQQKGVHFQHGLSWKQVLAKAKAEKKYIFVDCYTTWCGPCKYMSNTIFPQEAVGNALNDRFINVKMQLDTSDADNAEVRKLYATAHRIAADNHVNVYPTYLFFNPDGKLVHRAVGSSEAEPFIAKTIEALNPQTQYYTLLADFEHGNRDTAFLYELTKASMDAYDLANSSRIADAYLASQADHYTLQNLRILKDMTQTSADKGFQVFLNDPAKADSVLGDGAATALLQTIILREDVYPLMFEQKVSSASDLVEPDWSLIEQTLAGKYPSLSASLLSYAKVMFYMNKSDWEKFGPAVVAYMQSFGGNASVQQLNSFAWTVFQNCADEACLQQALSWSQRSVERTQNPEFIDTYANILYRLGQSEEAMLWEQKAMELVPEESKTGYLETLNKMKSGEKTWN